MKILQAHKAVHSNNAVVQCLICKKHLKSKHSLKNHMNQVHNTEIKSQFFKCPICEKSIKLRSSLNRHLKRVHPNNQFNNTPTQSQKLNQEAVKSKVQREESEETVLNEPSIQMKRNSSGLITEIDKGIEPSLNEKCLQLLLDTNKQDSDQLREICLSIPDLTQEDQEITLGEYITYMHIIFILFTYIFFDLIKYDANQSLYLYNRPLLYKNVLFST